MHVLFIYGCYENLGIEYLSANLKKAGHETSLVFDPLLFDENFGLKIGLLGKIFNYRRKLLKKINDAKPDLVCFSVVTDNYSWASKFAAEIKRSIDVPILFGGIHPTSVPEIVIKDPSVDFLCVGEGEEAIVELVNQIEEGIKNEKDMKIKNIWFKDKKGKIIMNSPRPLIQDLDNLPFADKELFYTEYPGLQKEYTTITSRGCPFDCSYCSNNFLRRLYSGQRYLRKRSVNNVIKELKTAKEKYNFKFVRFLDEVFTTDKKWIQEFSKVYKKEVSLPFFCNIHPSTISKEIVDSLKKAGCISVQMGLETTAKENKNKLNRDYSNTQVSGIIRMFKDSGITLALDIILGIPGQDKKELDEISYFLSDNMPKIINTYWLRHYPKTKISESYEIKKDKKEETGYASKGDSYDIQISKYQTLFLLFHFIPRSVRRFILKRGMKILPPSNPVFNTILLRTFKKAKHDLNRSRMIRRYLYFGRKKIIGF